MAEQPLAFSSLSPPVSEQDYEALHAVVAESAQGRWFLQEYARRHRAADTQLLLDAIARLERFLATSDAGDGLPRLYAQLDMAKAIAQARAEVAAPADTSDHDEDRGREIAALLSELESRLAHMLEAAEGAPRSFSIAAQEQEVEPAGEQNEEQTPVHPEAEVEEGQPELETPQAELKMPQAPLEIVRPGGGPIEALPLAAEPIASELRTENESFELELEPLHVEPLLSLEREGYANFPEPQGKISAASEPQEGTGSEHLSVAAEFAALAASLAGSETRWDEEQTIGAGAAIPSAEACASATLIVDEQIGYTHANESLSENELLLLLCDHTGRKNLPALASLYPVLLFPEQSETRMRKCAARKRGSAKLSGRSLRLSVSSSARSTASPTLKSTAPRFPSRKPPPKSPSHRLRWTAFPARGFFRSPSRWTKRLRLGKPAPGILKYYPNPLGKDSAHLRA